MLEDGFQLTCDACGVEDDGTGAVVSGPGPMSTYRCVPCLKIRRDPLWLWEAYVWLVVGESKSLDGLVEEARNEIARQCELDGSTVEQFVARCVKEFESIDLS